MGTKRETTRGHARKRLVDAFWTLLDAMPYERMTVAMVARCAGVHRNAFYYHYSDLDDLAGDAIAARIPFDRLCATLRTLRRQDTAATTPFTATQLSLADTAARLVTGSHGDARLRRVAKDTAIDMALASYGLDRHDLDGDEAIGLELAMDGIAGVMAMPDLKRHHPGSVMDLWRSPWVANALAHVDTIARGALDRQ
ncbi:MAG: TetR/AcrR family transcriptional regulator [Bifidobacterium sp.]|nr:TetR/AcrR family transcriptional regulator [Bifidobacterium sp.]